MKLQKQSSPIVTIIDRNRHKNMNFIDAVSIHQYLPDWGTYTVDDNEVNEIENK